MEPPPSRQDRISAGGPHGVYETLTLAADLTGLDVNQFLVQPVRKEARWVIEREQVIHLSGHDCEHLPDLPENPPKPNARSPGSHEPLRPDQEWRCGFRL